MSTLKVDAIRHNSATSDAITTAADGTCTAKITSVGGGQLSNRNKIINGAMQISQRNGTSAVTTVNAYNIDRWQNAFSGTIGAYSFSQSTDSPDGFANSYKIDVTTADTSLGSTDVHYFRTALEGQDVQDFAKGTSSAKTFTLSFYVKATKTGTYIVNLTDADNSRECSASYTVSNTNWNRYTVSFPADTTGAFTNDNNVSLRVLFALSAGSSFQSGTLSTSWAASTDANRLVGQVNLADSTSNEWLITGVQLEVGDTATSFEHRSFGDELSRCQRYCYVWESSVAYSNMGTGYQTDANNVDLIYTLPQIMRASPSFSSSGSFRIVGYDSGSQNAKGLSSFSMTRSHPRSPYLRGVISGGTGGAVGELGDNGSNNAKAIFSAEL